MTTFEDVCVALGDGTRREILEELRRRPCSVGALAEMLPVTRPAVSQHLKVLQEAGLVGHRSEGTRNVYHLDPSGLEPLRSWLDAFWQDALDSFAEHVRRHG
ncbi:MAG: ArsR/SmtB family transcription factor [Actinomycetes bacterium]